MSVMHVLRFALCNRRLRLDGFNLEVIDRIHAGALRRCPKLEIFKGWGIVAQNHEGQILKDVLFEGGFIDRGIDAM